MGVVSHFQALLLNSRGDKTLLKLLAQEVQRSGCSPNLLLYKDPKQEMPHLLNLPLKISFMVNCQPPLSLFHTAVRSPASQHAQVGWALGGAQATRCIHTITSSYFRYLFNEMWISEWVHMRDDLCIPYPSTNRSSRSQLISLLAGGASSLSKPKQCNPDSTKHTWEETKPWGNKKLMHWECCFANS